MLLRRGHNVQAAVFAAMRCQKTCFSSPITFAFVSLVRRASGASYSEQDAENDTTSRNWNDLGYHPKLATALAQHFPSPTTIQELAAAPLLHSTPVLPDAAANDDDESKAPSLASEQEDFARRQQYPPKKAPKRRNDRAHCHDTIVCAETGSGKTIAYTAPVLSRLLFEHERVAPGRRATAPCCLILCPNVLLCEQVLGVMAQCWGGAPKDEEPLFNFQFISGSTRPMTDIGDLPAPEPDDFSVSPSFPFALGRPNVFVSTPSGLLKHLAHFMDKGRQRNFVRSIRHLVLDEADALLSGFDQDIRGLVTLFVYGSAEQRGAAKFAKKDLAKYIAVNRGKMSVPQVVFAGATIPTQATKAAGSVLKKALPEAQWVEGAHKHKLPPQLQFKWLRLLDGKDASRDDAVLSVCRRAIQSAQGASDTAPTPPTILVFCNTVATAERLTQHLQQNQVDASPFHKQVSEPERRELLANVQHPSPSHGTTHPVHVVVSTDTAARGLDLPNVVHVVQAEFSPSAVIFLHRCGRTARAGRAGAVTSVFDNADMVLMKAVRGAVEASQPLDGLFSRRRSFRKSYRKQEKRRRADRDSQF